MNIHLQSPYARSELDFPTESEAFFHQYLLSKSFAKFEKFIGVTAGTEKDEAMDLVSELLDVVDEWLSDASAMDGWHEVSQVGPSRSLQDGSTQYAAEVSRLGAMFARLKLDDRMPEFRGRKIDPEVVWHAVGVNAQFDLDHDFSMSWEYGACLMFAETFSVAVELHEKAGTDQKAAYARQGATARWLTEASQIAKPAIRKEWESWWVRGEVQYENDEDFARKMHAKHGGYKSERSIANLSRTWKKQGYSA